LANGIASTDGLRYHVGNDPAFPDVDRLRICPWRKELLEGLLSNDLVAFQLQRDQRNFLAAAEAELGVASRGDQAFFGDRQVRVINVPIGADFDRISTILQDPELPARMRTLAQELGLEGKAVGIGVDRLDYTKGIPERMRAIEQVLERMPDIAPMFVFVQIGVPSRECLHTPRSPPRSIASSAHQRASTAGRRTAR
jgi:trehalose-6-phosphate synthase